MSHLASPSHPVNPWFISLSVLINLLDARLIESWEKCSRGETSQNGRSTIAAALALLTCVVVGIFYVWRRISNSKFLFFLVNYDQEIQLIINGETVDIKTHKKWLLITLNARRRPFLGLKIDFGHFRKSGIRRVKKSLFVWFNLELFENHILLENYLKNKISFPYRVFLFP